MRILKLSFLFILALTVFIFGADKALASVDIEVNKIAASPTEPARGEPCAITITVKNSGDETIPSGSAFSSVNASFYNYNQTGSTLASGPLAAGKTVTYKYEGYFTSEGEKNVSFSFDIGGYLDEISENNNAKNIKVTVVKPYDLYVENITLTPAYPKIDQDVIIEIKAKNSGYSTLNTGTGISSVVYSFPNFSVTDTTEPTINTNNQVESGEYFYYYYEGKFTSTGAKNLSFTIDQADQLDEKNEANNTKTKSVTVFDASECDLEVSNITFSIAKPIIGEDMLITIAVKNSGKYSLTDYTGLLAEDDLTIFPHIPADILYTLNDYTVSDFYTGDYPSAENPLDPGESFKYYFEGEFKSAGTKEVFFQANKNKRLGEPDINDNSLSDSILVYASAKARDDFNIINIKSESKSNTAVKISWETTQSSTGKLEYKRSQFTSYDPDIKTTNNALTHTVALADLKPGVQYEYKIIATHSTTTKESINYFTTPADNELNITSGPAVSVNNENKAATVTWTTNLLATSFVYYKKEGGESYKETSASSLTTEHSRALSNLSAGQYLFYAYSKSDPGTEAQSQTSAFTITDESADAGAEEEEESEATEDSEDSAETESGEQAISITNGGMYSNLKGKIVLKVEANGEAYYIHPSTETMYYLGRPADAFQVMREQGVGITTSNLAQIPIGLTEATGPDSDNDGLSDIFEDAVGTDKNKSDSDGDGFGDKAEIEGGYNPAGAGSLNLSASFTSAHKGKIFLQVENNGEAWYINPADGLRYFLGRPADAFNVMRFLGLGISNDNFNKLN